jgi:hypothetical protein
LSVRAAARDGLARNSAGVASIDPMTTRRETDMFQLPKTFVFNAGCAYMRDVSRYKNL